MKTSDCESNIEITMMQCLDFCGNESDSDTLSLFYYCWIQQAMGFSKKMFFFLRHIKYNTYNIHNSIEIYFRVFAIERSVSKIIREYFMHFSYTPCITRSKWNWNNQKTKPGGYCSKSMRKHMLWEFSKTKQNKNMIYHNWVLREWKRWLVLRLQRQPLMDAKPFS